jgi:predicted lipid-binding transport protein (Tim44 family)|tara:strand:+ start:149 stop:781 length:633 start_codon:yes stop_codon:yes gene_type:complete
MQNGLPYLDILIFAIIAIFLVFRLKNILGTKAELDETKVKKDKDTNNFSNVISIDKKQTKDEYDKEVIKIQQIDKSFNKQEFLSGSEVFFKMVLDSFVLGNLDKVKDFIKPSILKNFNLVINERKKEKETLIIDIKSINKIELISATVSKANIKINVLFETFQIKALKDKTENIIDGDINEEILVKDIWVFERKINDINPNYTLIETKSL